MLRNTQILGIAVLLFGASTSYGSPLRQAPIRVSLVIQESCVIQSATGSGSARVPDVSCLHGTPYSVALTSSEPTQPLSTLQAGDRTTEHAVWTVAF